MHREFRAPAGVALLGLALSGGSQIRGLEIDNPTGYWLEISGIHESVPPFTNRWSYPVQPAATSIDVRPTVNAPGKSIAPGGGDPYTVKLLDASVAAYPGQGTGSLAKQVATAQQYVYSQVAMTDDEDGNQISLLNPVPTGKRAVVIAIGIQYSQGAEYVEPANSVYAIFQSGPAGVGPFPQFAAGNITPGAPAFWREFPPGVMTFPAGDDIRCLAYTAGGTGNREVICEMLYYLENS